VDADTAAAAMRAYSKELQRRAKGQPHTEAPMEVLPLVFDWAAALGAALARAPGRDAATTRVRCVFRLVPQLSESLARRSERPWRFHASALSSRAPVAPLA